MVVHGQGVSENIRITGLRKNSLLVGGGGGAEEPYWDPIQTFIQRSFGSDIYGASVLDTFLLWQ